MTRDVRSRKHRSAIGENLRRCRDKAGLSQANLARKAGLSRATVAAVELGRYRSTETVTLERLAEALGMDAASLLTVAPPSDVVARSIALGVMPPHVEAFLHSRWAEAVRPSPDEIAWLNNLPLLMWRGLNVEPQVAAELLAWRRRNSRV